MFPQHHTCEIPVAPEVGAATVSSPAGVLELDTHSSSEVDPSKSSPPPVSIALMVLPFLCSDDSKSDTKIPERHVSPTTCIPDIPTTLILPAPSTVDIPISRLYCTHPGGPYRALTARKSVRPLPFHRLALRYTSHHLDYFTSGSSSSHSFSDHSSSGHSILGHSLSGHTPPDTADADSSTPPRFFHPLLARTPRCNEVYLCWRSAPLSTMYPPMTSESSVGDSSSKSSTGPSRKRCRSPAATVTLSIRAMRALVPSHADLFPPRKRFRDSNSPEDSVEEDIDTDVLEDIETRQRGLESRSLIAGGERANLLEQVAFLERRNVRLRGTMMMERARADSPFVCDVALSLSLSRTYSHSVNIVHELGRSVEMLAIGLNCDINLIRCAVTYQRSCRGDLLESPLSHGSTRPFWSKKDTSLRGSFFPQTSDNGYWFRMENGGVMENGGDGNVRASHVVPSSNGPLNGSIDI
ncbi:hypothetical protein Tco_0174684 [Tanacetum coccineum]